MAIRALYRNKIKVGYDVQVSIRHPTTRKKHFLRRRARTKWEAETLSAQLKQELRDQVNGRKIPRWEDFLISYERDCLVNKAASTKHNELSILKAHANVPLSKKLLDQINEGDIRSIIQNVPADRSESLKHNIRKCLKNVFNYALDCRYIKDNPCTRIRLGKIPEPQLNILSGAQIKTFLRRAIGTEWYPIWAFGIYSGLRAGELIALRWKHIVKEGENTSIRVQDSWTRKGGYKPYPKNKKMRSVPVNKPLLAIIEGLKKKMKCDPDDFVLPQLPAWKAGDAAKELKAFLHGCSLPPIRFHDLRSCFISQCLIQKVTPAIVMMMVGHSEMKTMMRYTRYSGSEIIGQTDKLDFSSSDDDV